MDRVVGFSLGILLSRIVIITTKEIGMALGIRGILQSLASKIEVIQALLSDSRRMNLDSQATALWMKRLEAAAYEGLNLLDDYEYILLKGKQDNACRFVMAISFFGLSVRIKKVKSNIDGAYGELLQMGLLLDSESKSGLELKQIVQTDFSVIKSDIVGREKDVNNVVEMLLNPDFVRDISVISVVGMAGVGKTTLAQLVYNDPSISHHFEIRMWVSVATDFNVDRILKEILEHLTLESVNVSSRGAVLEMLRPVLKGRRYLLVLDDVWNENHELWDSIRKCLHQIGSSQGSKILVTTRNLSVSISIRSAVNYHLPLLTFSESCHLFHRIAFAGGWSNQTPAVVDNINRIVKRCEGLPLAIKAIGGLVYSGIDKSKLLNLGNIGILWSPFDSPNQLFTSLKWSYDSLPSMALKQCFVYCSLFPRHSVLEKEDLLQLWMAQGFIITPHNQCQEMDLGDEHFILLIQRSLLQEVERDFSSIKSCKMHEVVHEFASSLLEHFCVITEDKQADTRILSSCAHIYLICRERRTVKFGRKSFPMLRTLILEYGILPRWLGGIQYVRVLILINPNALHLPGSIRYLKHLRYLDISRTRIERLPNFITELYNLQTLRLYTLVKMPWFFSRLINLRHLHIENVFYNNRYCLLPGVGELVNLRIIPPFVVSQETGCRILELGPLHFLKGELKIFGLENVNDGKEASRANLSSKAGIQTLELHWDISLSRGGPEDDNILQSLRPNSNLQCLAIFNFAGSRFPSWMAESRESSLFTYMVAIKLQNCNRCTQIPALGHLPSLKVVQINIMKNVEHITEDFYAFQDFSITSNMFPVLTDFTVIGMSSLEMWSEPPSMAVFQSLEKLTINGCPKLTSLPDGINFTTLRRLSIINCGKLNRLPKGLGSMVSLEYLEILHCNYLEKIPNISRLQALHELSIVDCKKLHALPTGLEKCKLLRDLYILSCPLMHIEGDLHLSVGLSKLEIGCFSDDLDYFPWPCSISSITSPAEHTNPDIRPLPPHFISLTSLKLCGWPELSSLPEQVQHIPQLNHLHVCLFHGLKALPEWLAKIKSLATLDLEDCLNLASLPSVTLTKLQKLTILRCPLLEQRCRTTAGVEWDKIKHIPHIYLGRREWES